MVQFWETLLLDVWTFHGGAFRPHLELHKRAPLRHGHFERWLYLWRMSVDDLFVGARADKAKHRAERIAAAFESRLRSLEPRDEGAAASGPLVIEHVG
jgi:hemoglobin